MEFNEDVLDFEIPEISQVGIVVEDLDDGMERFKTLLGLESWTVMSFEPPELTNATYKGEDADYTFRIALTTAGEIDVELIEPLTGENAYTEHLDKHGERLHHVAYYTYEDGQEIIDEFRDAGISVVQSGEHKGNMFWYLDTREEMNGVLFEVVEQ